MKMMFLVLVGRMTAYRTTLLTTEHIVCTMVQRVLFFVITP